MKLFENMAALQLTMKNGRIVNLYTMREVVALCGGRAPLIKNRNLSEADIIHCKDVISLKFMPGWRWDYIPNDFMAHARNLNCEVWVPECIERIGNGFLQDAKSFRGPLHLPENLQVIGDNFLRGAEKFNDTVELHEGLREIGNYFLSFCSAFNRKIEIPDTVTNIGDSFMYGCTVFNSDVVFNIPTSNLRVIGDEFLASCNEYNKQVILPDHVRYIGCRFMRCCGAFNQMIVLSESLDYVGEEFLRGADDFENEIRIECKLGALHPNQGHFIDWHYNWNSRLTCPINDDIRIVVRDEDFSFAREFLFGKDQHNLHVEIVSMDEKKE